MKRKNKSSIAYIIVFVITFGVLSFFSARHLINYYINDEVINNDWSAESGTKLESDVASTFFGKTQFVNINGAIRNVLGQREMNGVVKLNNGYLLTTMDYVDDETLQNYADRVKSFKDAMEAQGIQVLYAITPYTSSKYDPELPTGVEDYGNDNADRLIEYIDAAGVETLDFREKMHDDGIDQYDMMYKTDHHWTTQAGLYAYGVLEDYIVEKTGCQVDERISDESQYTITNYEKWHLGSRGQRTGRFFAGVDDFALYMPNYDVMLTDENGNTQKAVDLLINTEPLEKRDYTSRLTYDDVYERTQYYYENLSCPNDVNVLMVSDSFARVVSPYVIMGFSKYNYVYDYDVSTITQDYIDDFQPDVIILMYYAGNATMEGAYDFYTYDKE